MQMNQTLLNLAKRNREQAPESWDHLRRNTIIRDIRKKGGIPSEHEELATLRKTLDKLIHLYADQTGKTETEIREIFADFYRQTDTVNRIKQEVDKELGIGGDNFGY